MGLFDFMSMNLNYEDRAISRFEDGDTIIDTCSVNDSSKPFETGIEHPLYNDGNWVIVELYDSKDDAKVGHDKWVKKMTAKTLPLELVDVSTAEITELMYEEGWRKYPKKLKKQEV